MIEGGDAKRKNENSKNFKETNANRSDSENLIDSKDALIIDGNMESSDDNNGNTGK